MRLVICDGIQYDADNLPAHVDAKRVIPADQWFAQNRVVAKPAKKAPAPQPSEAKADAGETVERKSAGRRRRGAKQ